MEGITMGRADDLYNRFVKEGKTFIDELVANQQSEELFLDYKLTEFAETDKKLPPQSRLHLAKAISGFGNSEGGVIIWGVRCVPSEGGDIPSGCPGLPNPKGFVSFLQ